MPTILTCFEGKNGNLNFAKRLYLVWWEMTRDKTRFRWEMEMFSGSRIIRGGGGGGDDDDHDDSQRLLLLSSHILLIISAAVAFPKGWILLMSFSSFPFYCELLFDRKERKRNKTNFLLRHPFWPEMEFLSPHHHSWIFFPLFMLANIQLVIITCITAWAMKCELSTVTTSDTLSNNLLLWVSSDLLFWRIMYTRLLIRTFLGIF